LIRKAYNRYMPHKSQKELQKEIEKATEGIKVGRKYTHYKSPTMRYVVKELAVNTEHDAVCVIYQALYDEQLTFVRSTKEWLDEVEKDGKRLKRFTLEEEV